jgi:hypothetical protein
LGDGGDVFGGVSTAATGEVEEACLGEFCHVVSHVVGFEIEAGGREWVRQASVRITGNGGGGTGREFF